MPMSNVIRVVKNCNYTTLSNYHFKDKRLSWKAKGLLSTMLSLPDNWNYTIEGLAGLSDDGVKATNSGLAELEKCGYLIRKQLRDDTGRFVMMEYTIYEKSIEEPPEDNPPAAEITEPLHVQEQKPPLRQNGQTEENRAFSPLRQSGQTEENRAFSPLCQNRQTGKRQTEKVGLLNTNILNTKELSTYPSLSNPNPLDQTGADEDGMRHRQLRERLVGIRAAPRSEVSGARESGASAGKMDERESYRNIIKKNIEYDCLIGNQKYGRKEKIDELIELMLDILCSGRRTICIAGGDYPAESVKARFLMLRSDHVEYVLSSMEKTTTQIRNIKKYLLAALYNAPMTIENYYSALVNYDMNYDIYVPKYNGR